MSLSLDDLNQRLLSLDLLDLDKIRAVETSFGSKLFTADEFLRTAQRYGYLTKYQVERLMAGETTGFYYGDYRIQYLIGAGSFARVFRCVHRESGKVFAVKVLRARFRDDQTAIQEFIREGEMGMELRHPNIFEELTDGKELTDEIKSEIDSAYEEYKESFLAEHEEYAEEF